VDTVVLSCGGFFFIVIVLILLFDGVILLQLVGREGQFVWLGHVGELLMSCLRQSLVCGLGTHWAQLLSSNGDLARPQL